jgi:hypothetical protein
MKVNPVATGLCVGNEKFTHKRRYVVHLARYGVEHFIVQMPKSGMVFKYL